MNLRCFVPADTTAVAVGADAVAAALALEATRRDLSLDLVRNGSRGAFWLEPLVEVEWRGERLAFGPVTPGEVDSLLDALALELDVPPEELTRHITCPTSQLRLLRYVENDLSVASRYPANPNGSPDGISGLCSLDGRVTIMMPHPERVYRTVQNSWAPADWGEDGGWMRLFRNARHWLG